jgi:signal transduction histidine kinase
MKRARKEMKSETREFRIVSETSEGRKSYIFRFTTTPLVLDDKFHYLFHLEDISGEKRQAELERIFFHDIMNSIGSLHGVINLIKGQQNINPQHLQILEASYNTIFDTVNEQRQIFQAEKGILDVRMEEAHSHDLLIENLLPFRENTFYRCNLEMNEDSADMLFYTDPNLLSRVLTNMIKNAMEASGTGDVVTVGCELIDGSIRFYVHNPGVIPKQVQLQLFERSFSTKGGGRGIGTYSMKLLGEEHLKGKVGFHSTEESGTRFWIDLPH